MKLHLSSAPAFGTMACWEAKAPIGGRGTVTCGWHSTDGPREVAQARWRHPFTETDFEDIRKRLSAMPSPLVALVVDDAGLLEIGCEVRSETVVRFRYPLPNLSTPAEEAFQELWNEITVPVATELRALGVPPHTCLTGFGFLQLGPGHPEHRWCRGIALRQSALSHECVISLRPSWPPRPRWLRCPPWPVPRSATRSALNYEYSRAHWIPTASSMEPTHRPPRDYRF